jgi:cytochrome c551/c552
MIRTIVVAAVLGLGVTAVLAQSDPITERRNAMKAVGAATRDGAAIAKGEAPFEAAKAQAIAKAYIDSAKKMPGSLSRQLEDRRRDHRRDEDLGRPGRLQGRLRQVRGRRRQGRRYGGRRRRLPHRLRQCHEELRQLPRGLPHQEVTPVPAAAGQPPTSGRAREPSGGGPSRCADMRRVAASAAVRVRRLPWSSDMLRLRRLLVTLVLLAAVGLGGFYLLTDPRIVSPSPQIGALGAADLENGRILFAAGGCASCHATPEPGRQAEARAADSRSNRLSGPSTPPTSRPTPATASAIGVFRISSMRWRPASRRAGQHYYPSFPYTSYRLMPPKALADLFAYIRTLTPVEGRAPAHELPFPYQHPAHRRRVEAPVLRGRGVPARSRLRARNGTAVPIW